MTEKRKYNFIFSLSIFVAVGVTAAAIFFLPTHRVQAVVRTWDGGGTDGTCGGLAGDGNKWSCAANWSSDTLPGNTDVATFDGTSTKNATIDSSFAGSVQGVDINSGYTGTITQARSLTIGSGNYDQAAGTFNGAAQSIDLNGSFTLSSGSFTAPSSSFTISNNLTITGGTFLHNSSTITFDSAASSTLACNNASFNLVVITKIVGAANVTVGSDCSLPLGNSPSSNLVGGILANNGTITVGTGTWTIIGSYTGNSGSTLTMTGSGLTLSKNLTINSGSTFPANLNLTLNNASTGDTATLACNNVSFASVTITKVTGTPNLTVGSDCTLPLGNSPTSNLNGGTLTNNGTITVGTGTWSLNNAGLAMNSGSTLTMTGTSLSITKSLIINAGSTFPSSLDLTLSSTSTGDSATLACNNVSFNSVTITKNLGTPTVTVGSDCTLPLGNNATSNVNSSGSLVNNGTITTGTGTWTVRGNLTMNSGSTLTMTGTDLSVSRDLTINSGSAFPGGLNLTLSSFSTGDTATLACNNVSFNLVTITKTLGTPNVTVGSDCTLPLGNSPTSALNNGILTNNGTITVGTGTWTVGGSYTQNSGAAFNSSGTTVDINNGDLTLNGGTFSSNITTAFVEGSVTNTGTILPSGIALTLDGIDSTDDSTLICASSTLGSLTINKTNVGGVTTPSGSCTITGNLTRTDGIVANAGSVATWFAGGNLALSTTDAFGGSNITIELNGTGTQTTSNNGPATFSSPFNVNKNSGTASLSTNLTVTGQACNVIEGIFDINGKVFTCATGFTVQDGGTLQLMGSETPTTPTLNTGSTVSFKGDGDAAADTFTVTTLATTYYNLTINSTDGATDVFQLGAAIDVNGNFSLTAGTFNVTAGNFQMNVAGNWSKDGTFNASGGTVIFDGNSQSISGSTTFNNFTKNVTSAQTLTFQAGSTQTISGTWTLTGQSGNLLALRSSSTPTQWNVSPTGTRTLSFLDVQDSNNISGSVITVLGSNITDSGNNTGWDFNDTPVVSSLGPANYVNGSWGNDNTPTLTFSLSDPDVGDQVKFRIQVDDSSNFGSPVVDYTSALQAQGSATFTVGQAVGSGSYTVGTAGQTLTDASGYYWRVQVIDEHGDTSSFTSANSGSIAFKIDTVAPTAGTLSLGTITPSSITATVSGASDALSGLASSAYNFTNTTASTSSGFQVASSWASNSLSPNVSYTFQATISDAAGNTATTNTASNFTAANPPASLNLAVDSGTQITASWSVNSNPTGTEFFAENVTQGTDSGWVADAANWVSSGLDPGTQYTFTVKARNSDGLETTTITADATTSGGPGGASFLGPANLVDGSWGNDNTPMLTFSLSDPDVGDQVRYHIQIDDSSNFASPVVDYTSALQTQGSASFTVGQAAGSGSYTLGNSGQTLTDSSYYWRVQVIDEHGDTSSFTEANGGAVAFQLDTVAPNGGTLAFSGQTTTSITVTVNGTSDAASGLATNPYIFTNTDTAQTSGAQSSNSWTNNGLSASTTYSYQVQVSDAAGNATIVSGSSSTTSGGGGGGGVGSASSLGPANLVDGSWGKDNTPTLTFSLSDPDLGDQVKYHIQIDDTAGFSSPVVDYTSALQTQGSASFTVGQAAGSGSYTVGTSGQTLADNDYYWRVQVIDEHGDTSSFTEANGGGIAFRLDTVAPNGGSLTFSGQTTTSITAHINSASDAASGLAVNPYIFTNTTTAQTSGAQSSTSWINNGLTAGTSYSYQVQVTDLAGNSTTVTGSSATLAATGGGSGGGAVIGGGGSNPPPTDCSLTTQQAQEAFKLAMETAKAAYETVMQQAQNNRQAGIISNKQYQDIHAAESAKWNLAKEAARAARKAALEQVCDPVPTEPPIPVPTPTPINNRPVGYLDGIKLVSKVVFGWAQDPDSITSIQVHLYFDRNAGTVGAVPIPCYASDFRSDVGAHAFNCPIPPNLQDGLTHNVWAWGIDTDAPTSNNAVLVGSPKTFTIATILPPAIPPTTPPSIPPTVPPTVPPTQPPAPAPSPVPNPTPSPAPENPPTPTTPPTTPPVTPPTAPPQPGPNVPPLPPAPGTVAPPPEEPPPTSGQPPIAPPTNSGQPPTTPPSEGGNGTTDTGHAATTIMQDLGNQAKTIAQNITDNLPINPETITTVNKITPVIALPLFALASYATFLSFGPGGLALTDLGLLVYRWLLELASLLGLRKKRRYWGTVYDSVTKQPLDPAIVKLIDARSGRVVEEAITDLMGRFGFLVVSGAYTITALKTHYAFPSQKITANSDNIFDNLYHGQTITISSPTDIVSPNIPMDPLAFDWNQAEKEKQKVVENYHPFRNRAVQMIASTIFALGFILALLITVAQPKPAHIFIFALYLVVGLFRLVRPPQRLWGRLLVGPNQAPLANAKIIATMPGWESVVVGRAQTGSDGKFFLKVPQAGSYQLNISQEPENQLLWKGNVDFGKDGLLNKDITLG